MNQVGSRPSPHLPRSLLAGWLLLVILLDFLFGTTRAVEVAAWPVVLGIALARAALWTLALELAFHLTRRHPLTRRDWTRSLRVHLGAGVLLAAADRLITLGAYLWAGSAPAGFGLRHFFPFLLIYLLLVGVAHAVEYARWHRQKEVEELRLQGEVARAALGRSQAELRALKMELNPHFLFNSLHAISVLMREDAPTAQRMLGHLGQLLRRSFDSTGIQKVTLAEELEYLRPFLEIEQARLGERLRVSWQVDPATLGERVPHMILQPIVENAIKHGIGPSRRGGCIAVSARIAGEHLELEVCDDGAGLGEDHRRTAKGTGVGLTNVRERLRQLYAERAGFVLKTAPERGTRALLRIPRSPAPGATPSPAPGPEPLPALPDGDLPDRQPPLLAWIGGHALAAWFVINAAISSNAWRGLPLQDGGTIPLPLALTIGTFNGVVLTAFLGGAVLLTRRFPLRGARWRSHLWIHAGTGALLAGSGWASRIAIALAVGYRGGASVLESAVGTIPTLFVLYALLVGAAHALEYARLYRQKEIDELRLEARLAASELERTRSQLRALKMELNPRFLLSSLEAISALVREDVATAHRLLLQLGQLLRYGLERAGVQEVALEEELEGLKPFLEIERTRCRPNLDVELCIDEETLDLPVPHLILQPLVEEAIRCAAALTDSTSIRLSTRIIDDGLHIEVRSQGASARTEAVSLPAARAVSNLRERLLRLYGPRARLDRYLEREGDEIILLRIPIPGEGDMLGLPVAEAR